MYQIPKITGWLADETQDERDALYGAFETISSTLPSSYELPRLPGIHSQAFASCVGEALSRIQEYSNAKENDGTRLSARYVYGWCKQLDGSPTLEGTYFRIGLKVLQDKGVAPLVEWPVGVSQYSEYIQRPSSLADTHAADYRIKGYVTFQTVNEIKDYIWKNGLPVLIGLNANNTSWGYAAVHSPDFVLPEPAGGRTGHAVICVGWNEQGLIFENSFGPNWASAGRATVPYTFSGLQGTSFAVFDLLNNWQSINQQYKETMANTAEINALQYATYRAFLGRDPKPEETKIIAQRNADILVALKKGGPAGQDDIDNVLKGFRAENRQAVETNKI